MQGVTEFIRPTKIQDRSDRRVFDTCPHENLTFAISSGKGGGSIFPVTRDAYIESL